MTKNIEQAQHQFKSLLIEALNSGTTHYHSDNLSDYDLDSSEHEDWKHPPIHDLSLLDGVTNIDPTLRQLRHNRVSDGETIQTWERTKTAAEFDLSFTLRELNTTLERFDPTAFDSKALRQVRHYFKQLCSSEMKILADKLVTVPLIIDGKRAPSVCSQASDSAPQYD